MKNTLFICLFAMFALSGCVDDEEEFATGGNISPELTPENKENAVLNTAVFDQLNLDYPGLEKVKQYHEAGAGLSCGQRIVGILPNTKLML